MTVRQWCENYCIDRGMRPDQAAATVKDMESHKRGKPVEGRWEDDISGYLNKFQHVLVLPLRHAALEFIDRECPRALFRSSFVDETID